MVLSIPLPNAEDVLNTTESNTTVTTATESNSTNNNIPLPPLPPPPAVNIQQNPQFISSPLPPTKTIPSPIKTVVPPTKMVSTPKQLTKVPTIATLNTPPSVKNKPVNNIPSESVPQTQTNIGNIDYKYSLIGVVQLPENASFALFKINDLTEKVAVGTEIGTSGWVLMAINGAQAVVSRENQSINIRVGETF